MIETTIFGIYTRQLFKKVPGIGVSVIIPGTIVSLCTIIIYETKDNKR